MKWNKNSVISLKQLEKKSSQCAAHCQFHVNWNIEQSCRILDCDYQLWLTDSSASVSLASSGSESGAVPETVLASEASSASATDATSCSHTSDKHMSQQNIRHMKWSEPFLWVLKVVNSNLTLRLLIINISNNTFKKCVWLTLIKL